MQKKGGFKKHFITGLFLVLPIGISIWVLIMAFTWADSLLGDVLNEYLGLRIPGLGIVISILIVYLIGVFSSRWIGVSITRKLESLLQRIPILKVIYKPLKNIFSKFSDVGQSNFKQVVLVDFPDTKGKSIGFITNTHITLDAGDKVCVFVPTSPNPTMGFLMFYDKADVTAVDLTVEQGLSMVLSIGSSFEGAIHTSGTLPPIEETPPAPMPADPETDA